MKSLFAVYLGGHAKNATLEVHDIAFVTGTNVKSTFPKLRELWFGDRDHVHVDSWVDLSFVDGYEIVFGEPTEKTKSRPKLYFVNAGFYEKEKFGEQHQFLFLVDTSMTEVRKRVKEILQGSLLLHVDNLLEIDLIKEVEVGEKYYMRSHDLTQKNVAMKASEIHQVFWPIRSDTNEG